MKNNSSEAHPGTLPRERAFKTKIKVARSLEKSTPRVPISM